MSILEFVQLRGYKSSNGLYWKEHWPKEANTLTLRQVIDQIIEEEIL